MKTFFSRRTLNRTTGAVCLAGLFCQALPALGAEAPPKEEASADDGDLRNWIDVTVGGNLLRGDRAAFQQRTGQPRDAWGGVTDFHYEQDIGKRSLFEVDGRGIFDAHNYSISLSLKDPNLGYIKAGFEEFTSYYDLTAGYSPRNGRIFDLYPGPGEVDRSKVFFEAALTLEGKPQVRVRYDYDARSGDKDSTIWGETTLTGITPSGARKIVPSINRLDEDRHTVALDLSHTIGETEVGVGGRYSFSTYDNRRYMRRNPTEASDRFLTHREGVETDMMHARAWTETDLRDNIKFTTAYSFTRLDTDLSGDRAVGGAFDASPLPSALQAFARRQNRDHGFYALTGGSAVDQHVAAISLMYRPTDHVTIVPALRIEKQDQNGQTDFVDTEVNSARNVITEDIRNTRKRDFLDVTQALEARYTGFTNWVLYARGELLEGSGTVRETDKILDVATYDIFRETDSTRFTQKYTAGATWYPHRRVNVASQYYHRVRENEYESVFDNTPVTTPAPAGGFYPAFIRGQTFTTDDANVRVTIRPVNQLTLVSRYDFQYTPIDSQMEARARVESANSAAHIFSESVTWTPIQRMYVQLAGSYTMDRLHSPGDDILPNRLQSADNDYLTASATVGYALTEKTDLTGSYAYFLADNYDPGIILTGYPYGASLEEHTVGGSVVHRFSKRMALTTRYAYMRSRDKTSGGNNDFEAHLLSSTLRYRF